MDLREEYRNLSQDPVAVEFVGTSISSGGDGSDQTSASSLTLAENPQVKLLNLQRGYVSCTVQANRWRTDYRVLPFVNAPGAAIQTRASFIVENGKPGLQKA